MFTTKHAERTLTNRFSGCGASAATDLWSVKSSWFSGPSHEHLVIDHIYGALFIQDKQKLRSRNVSPDHQQPKFLENCCLVQIRNLDYRFVSAQDTLFYDLTSVLSGRLSNRTVSYVPGEGKSLRRFYLQHCYLPEVKWNSVRGWSYCDFTIICFHATHEGEIK